MPSNGLLIDPPATYSAAPRFVASPSDPEPYVDVDALRAVFEELLSDFAECMRLLVQYAPRTDQRERLAVIADRDIADYRQAWRDIAGGGEV